MSSRAEVVLIGLGGNIGDPLAAMKAALGMLEADKGTTVLRVSSVWKTPPWGVVEQPDFLNACAVIRTTLAPRGFLELCLSIEQGLKRVRDKRWGPRSIDIDILTFGERVIDEPGLTVPHPRIGERAFVLVPLAEIAGTMMLEGTSVTERAGAAGQAGMERISGPEWYPATSPQPTV